ncbi:MAG: hypothetical protein JWN56_1146 [Sphingobacteriales bacterium]|nr:hypothetical protein [Sphingobacteriales bacterium]
MNLNEQLQQAFDAFDLYNSADPNREIFEGDTYPKEVLYALRMTEKLNDFAFDVPDYLQLAARSQHIGRWEIARSEYPMDRKGYLQWRSQLKLHHAAVAEKILRECKYDDDTIEKVKALLLKKQLHQNPDTQLLEDVICLVFIQYYLDEFAAKHEDDKVIDIIQKTLKKMSPHGIDAAVKIPVSDKVGELIGKAAAV